MSECPRKANQHAGYWGCFILDIGTWLSIGKAQTVVSFWMKSNPSIVRLPTMTFANSRIGYDGYPAFVRQVKCLNFSPSLLRITVDENRTDFVMNRAEPS